MGGEVEAHPLLILEIKEFELKQTGRIQESDQGMVGGGAGVGGPGLFCQLHYFSCSKILGREQRIELKLWFTFTVN